jgi:hypothetical protein
MQHTKINSTSPGKLFFRKKLNQPQTQKMAHPLPLRSAPTIVYLMYPLQAAGFLLPQTPLREKFDAAHKDKFHKPRQAFFRKKSNQPQTQKKWRTPYP